MAIVVIVTTRHRATHKTKVVVTFILINETVAQNVKIYNIDIRL